MSGAAINPVTNAVGVSFNVTFPSLNKQKNGEKSLVLQTHFSQDVDVREALSPYFAEIDYRNDLYEILAMQDAIRNIEQQIDDTIDNIEAQKSNGVVEHKLSNRKGDYRMPLQLAQQVALADRKVMRFKSEIQYLTGEIKVKKTRCDEYEKSSLKSKKVA